MNEPVIPAAFEVFGVMFVTLYASLVIVALVTVAKSPSLSEAHRVGWVLAIILLPLVGAITWIALYIIEGARIRGRREN